MAKKKAKKAAKTGLIPAIIVLLVSILSIAMLATPLTKVTKTIGNTTNVEEQTALEFFEAMNEKGDEEDATSAIEDMKAIKAEFAEAQTKLDNAKKELENETNSLLKPAKQAAVNAAQAFVDELKLQLEPAQKTIVIYDTILSTIIIASIAMVISLIAVVLAVLKKGPSSILALVGIIAVFAIFIVSCVMLATQNSLLPEATDHVVSSTIAPILVLVVSLLGTLAGGVTAFLGKRK